MYDAGAQQAADKEREKSYRKLLESRGALRFGSCQATGPTKKTVLPQTSFPLYGTGRSPVRGVYSTATAIRSDGKTEKL